jgi:hypothetical protein
LQALLLQGPGRVVQHFALTPVVAAGNALARRQVGEGAFSPRTVVGTGLAQPGLLGATLR